MKGEKDIVELIELIYAIFRLALIPTIFMFLAFNATRPLSKRNRYIVLTSVSFVLLLGFVLAYIVDCVLPHGSVEAYFSPFIYYVLFITSGIYFVLSIVFLILNIKNNENIYRAKRVNKKMVYTVRPKEEYLYVFYRYKDTIYLLKDTHSGIKYKLKKQEFSDDAIKKVNDSMKVDITDEIERNGMVTVSMNTHDDVFYCFMVDIDKELENEYLESYKMNEIDEIGLMDFDKFVILNCFIKTNFDERF